MSAELLSRLEHWTLLLSLALAAVLVLRGPWLRCFGAKNAMLLWLSVPATLLAVLFPAPIRRIEVQASSAFAPETAVPLVEMPRVLSEPAASMDGPGLLVAMWVIGAVLMTALLMLRQWRYRRSLGRLDALPDGSFRSEFSDMGPALVGALRPRIVVPADFDRRYTTAQQSLIMAHERCHLRRGDAQLTLLACVIRCLFWFNPLVHLAWSRFRLDQELACDASVLSAHPDFRREYAEAMLSTQFAASQLPVGCTWLTGDPLRRRITMLYTHPPGKIKLLVGTVLALSASTAAAVGAWSSQEPQLRYLSADTPQLELLTVAARPPAPELAMPEPAPEPPVPDAEAAPPTPAVPAPPSPAAPPTPEPAPLPADTSNAVPEPKPTPAPEVRPQSTSRTAPTVDVQPARLVEVTRPSFPRSVFKPQLVSYPGMPEAEQPASDWKPDGKIWRMELRVVLDETGEPIETAIAENNLGGGGMVRRYERLALRAVRDWSYEPAQVDGVPVTSELMLAFHFETNMTRDIPMDRTRDIGRGPLPVTRQVFNKAPRTWK